MLARLFFVSLLLPSTITFSQSSNAERLSDFKSKFRPVWYDTLTINTKGTAIVNGKSLEYHDFEPLDSTTLQWIARDLGMGDMVEELELSEYRPMYYFRLGPSVEAFVVAQKSPDRQTHFHAGDRFLRLYGILRDTRTGRFTQVIHLAGNNSYHHIGAVDRSGSGSRLSSFFDYDQDGIHEIYTRIRSYSHGTTDPLPGSSQNIIMIYQFEGEMYRVVHSHTSPPHAWHQIIWHQGYDDKESSPIWSSNGAILIFPKKRVDNSNRERARLLEKQMRAAVRYALAEPDSSYLVKEAADLGASLETRSTQYGRTPLDQAVRKNNFPFVKYLIDLGADPTSGLLPALASRRLELFQYLVAHGANLEVRFDKGNTLLHEMVSPSERDSVERRAIFDILIDHGIPVDALNKHALTPFQNCVERRDLQLMRWLVQAGADYHRKTGFHKGSALTRLPQVSNTNGLNLLDMARYLLSLGLDLNHADQSGRTALHYAANQKDTLAAFLIDHGADMELLDNQGQTAIHNASPIRSIRVFARRGANLNARDTAGQTVLFRKLTYSRLFHDLLKMDFDFKVQDNKGQTLIHHAARHKDTIAILGLLKKGVDINTKDHKGNTALYYARNKIEVSRFLIEHGADPLVVNNEGQTILYAPPLDSGLIRYYKNLGVLPFVKSPLLSVRAFSNQYVDFLISHGLDPNAHNEDGMTRLHYLCRLQTPEYLKDWLARDDVDPAVQDHAGHTAISYLLMPQIQSHPQKKRSLYQCLEVLQEAGLTVSKEDLVVFRNYLDTTQLNMKLIELAAKLGLTTTLPKTLLHRAVQQNNLDMVNWVLEQPGTKLNQTDSAGRTALHHAALYQDFAYYLPYESQRRAYSTWAPSYPPPGKATSMGIAPQYQIYQPPREHDSPAKQFYKATQITQALIRAGASKAIRDHQGRTPYDLARTTRQKNAQQLYGLTARQTIENMLK